MAEGLRVDSEKGELIVRGRRHTAIEAQALCEHLDTLVGSVVSEVIMNNLETRLGKSEAEEIIQQKKGARQAELVDTLIELDRLTGVGVTSVKFAEHGTFPIMIEIWNPSVKGTQGAARAFLFSWWAGALSALLKEDVEIGSVSYDEAKNMMKCEILPRKKA